MLDGSGLFAWVVEAIHSGDVLVLLNILQLLSQVRRRCHHNTKNSDDNDNKNKNKIIYITRSCCHHIRRFILTFKLCMYVAWRNRAWSAVFDVKWLDCALTSRGIFTPCIRFRAGLTPLRYFKSIYKIAVFYLYIMNNETKLSNFCGEIGTYR